MKPGFRMKLGYEPNTLAGKMLWLAEECNELARILTKISRMAELRGVPVSDMLFAVSLTAKGYDPDAPKIERLSNRRLIHGEIHDVLAAIAALTGATLMDREICVSGVRCGCSDTSTFRCLGCKKLKCSCQGAYDDGHLTDFCNDCSPKKTHAKKTKPQSKAEPKARSPRPRKKQSLKRQGRGSGRSKR